VGDGFELGQHCSGVPGVEMQAHEDTETSAGLGDTDNEEAACLLEGLRDRGWGGGAAAATYDDARLCVKGEAAGAVGAAAGEHAVGIAEFL
jgi:hypothetical protein